MTDSPAVAALLKDVGLGDLVPKFENESGVLNFYPAFGKNPNRLINNLIVSQDKTVDATWWYDCHEDGDTLRVGDRTTFNARNLDSPYWKAAIRQRRALVIGTAIGESNKVGSTNEHYLMKAKKGLLIGAVYREFSNGLYSTAVITRPPHDRFSQYHEKSIPFFLPHNKDFVAAWLADDMDDPRLIAELDNARIQTDLDVSRVKTFKGGVAMSESEVLTAD